MLISGLDTDIVVAPADVEYGEVARALQSLEISRDKQQRVFVLHRHHIQRTVVLVRATRWRWAELAGAKRRSHKKLRGSKSQIILSYSGSKNCPNVCLFWRERLVGQ